LKATCIPLGGPAHEQTIASCNLNSHAKNQTRPAYLQLQRLRRLVQKAETSRVQHVVEAKPRSSGINPQRRYQA
jgi:hypothetical protein